MPEVLPFRALRFDPATAGELSRLIAPPYDVISPEQQHALHEASPHNIVRLILGRERPTDTERDNRYVRARAAFDAWHAGGLLKRDARPAIYVTEHAFTVRGRRLVRLGFTALLGLDDGTVSRVFRHEATLSGPRADRARLLDAVPANLSPIFCVYPEESGAIQARLAHAVRARPADAEARAGGDVIRLWVMDEPAWIESVRAALRDASLLIADGHHRFEVACGRRDRYGAVMAYFASMADPALVVWPIHRVIGPGPAPDPKALADLVRLEPAEDLESLLGWLAEPAKETRFGYARGDALARAIVTSEARRQWLAAPGMPADIAALDVGVLHGLLLPGLGAAPERVRYAADAAEAVRAAGQTGQTAWLLRGVPLAAVHALASRGLTCPPKTTYFYPKVFSGLVINPQDSA